MPAPGDLSKLSDVVKKINIVKNTAYDKLVALANVNSIDTSVFVL